MVEPDAFEVGVDLAVTPGSVVLRTPVFELIQYRPATPTVRQVPLLIVRREGAIPMPISPEHRYGQVSIHLDRQAYSWRWRRAQPERAVLFYAADDAAAGDLVAGLIRAVGFDPVRVGGLDQSIRIEMFGDLHEFGALGRVVTESEAQKAI